MPSFTQWSIYLILIIIICKHNMALLACFFNHYLIQNDSFCTYIVYKQKWFENITSFYMYKISLFFKFLILAMLFKFIYMIYIMKIVSLLLLLLCMCNSYLNIKWDVCDIFGWKYIQSCNHELILFLVATAYDIVLNVI